jgi:hypothetical protein
VGEVWHVGGGALVGEVWRGGGGYWGSCGAFWGGGEALVGERLGEGGLLTHPKEVLAWSMPGSSAPHTTWETLSHTVCCCCCCWLSAPQVGHWLNLFHPFQVSPRNFLGHHGTF